jgi:hypothetical protein
MCFIIRILIILYFARELKYEPDENTPEDLCTYMVHHGFCQL